MFHMLGWILRGVWKGKKANGYTPSMQWDAHLSHWLHKSLVYRSWPMSPMQEFNYQRLMSAIEEEFWYDIPQNRARMILKLSVL